MKKYLIMLLMLWASTANASDNYNQTTGILTIPTVIVGNTIYSNVVLKENSFTVIGVGPNPLVGQVSGSVLYTYNGCYLTNILTCNMTLTSQVSIANFYICNTTFQLIDDKGNTYSAYSYKLANQSDTIGGGCYSTSLAANEQTPMQITFTNIAANASVISNFTIGGNGGKPISYTNIPFISGIAPSPF